MNKYEDPTSLENLVADIINHKIYLKGISDKTINALEKIVASQDKIADRPVWLIKFTSDHELAKKLHDLAGWPPADIFDQIRKKGLLSDNFKEVRWRSPGDWFVIER